MFQCEPFVDSREGLGSDGQYYDDGFGYADDDSERRQSAGTICAIEACAGSRVVASACGEEYTGDPYFRLFDSEWRLVAANDDALGGPASFDDDDNDNAAYSYYSEDDYYGQFPQTTASSAGAVLCSKIAYTVPAANDTSSSSSSSSCWTFYLQQSCRGEVACSGTTRVAGGLAAPSSQPSGVPTAAPSAGAAWKESQFVFSFRTSIEMRFKCGGSRCSGMTELDAAAQQAFLELFASCMRNESLGDVSIVSVAMSASYWPTMRGIFSTRGTTADSPGIPALIAALASEVQAVIAAESAALASVFVARSVALGSASVHENTTTVQLYPPKVSEDFSVQEVQTFVPSVMPSGEPSGQPSSRPSGEPSVVPSGEPSGEPSSRPSASPTSNPSRGRLVPLV